MFQIVTNAWVSSACVILCMCIKCYYYIHSAIIGMFQMSTTMSFQIHFNREFEYYFDIMFLFIIQVNFKLICEFVIMSIVMC